LVGFVNKTSVSDCLIPWNMSQFLAILWWQQNTLDEMMMPALS